MSEPKHEPGSTAAARNCVSIDWYSEGESRAVEVDGVQVTVRFIGRKGRRGRIAIEAPAGAMFQNNSVNDAHERSAG